MLRLECRGWGRRHWVRLGTRIGLWKISIWVAVSPVHSKTSVGERCTCKLPSGAFFLWWRRCMLEHPLAGRGSRPSKLSTRGKIRLLSFKRRSGWLVQCERDRSRTCKLSTSPLKGARWDRGNSFVGTGKLEDADPSSKALSAS